MMPSKTKAVKAPTKAELKRQTGIEKGKFVADVAAMAAAEFVKVMEGDLHTVEFKIKCQNRNRYIRAHVYGCTVAVLVYQNGNVELGLDCDSAGSVRVQVFDYEAEALTPEAKKDFIKKLKPVVSYMFACVSDSFKTGHIVRTAGFFSAQSFEDIINAVGTHKQLLRELAKKRSSGNWN